MTRALKQLKNSLLYYLVRGLLMLLQHAPLGWTTNLGQLLGQLAWFLARREKRRAKMNLKRAFPQHSTKENERLIQQMFVHLGQSTMECVLMSRLRPLLREKHGPVHFSLEAQDILAQALDRGRGVLYITAHLGNWELMAAMIAAHAPVNVLYKPSYDKRFTRLMETFRQQSGITGINVAHPGHIRRAIEALRRNEVVGILLDQPIAGCSVTFFNQLAPTSMLAARLAAREQPTVLAGFIYREGPCQHAISLQHVPGPSPSKDNKEWTQCLTQRLEEAVLYKPEQWLWSLDRWRSTGPKHLSSINANYIPSGNI